MSDNEEVLVGGLSAVSLNFEEADYVEPSEPTFHPFPRLPIELQINILQIACAPPSWKNGNDFMSDFVNLLWYWHYCRQNYISIYSTLMNEFVDERDHSLDECKMRKKLLRTCRLGREVSLKAIRRDIETNEMKIWEENEPHVTAKAIAQNEATKKRILDQIDAMIARTRLDPSPTFHHFSGLPKNLQTWIWEEAALEEEITTCNYFNNAMLDDMVMQSSYYGEKNVKFPGWYYWFMDGKESRRRRTDPYFPHPRTGLLGACRGSRLAALMAWRRDLAEIDMAKCKSGTAGKKKRDGFVRDLDEEISELCGKMNQPMVRK